MALTFGTSGIRGLNAEFDRKNVVAFVLGFIDQLKAKTPMEVREIAVAQDLRESSPGILNFVKEAVVAAGVAVLDLGRVSTPHLAFVCLEKKVAGVMVTGSHIPADRNGIKFYFPWGEVLKEDEAPILKGHETHLPLIADERGVKPYHLVATDLFHSRYLDFFGPQLDLKGAAIGVYEHSSAMRDTLTFLLKACGAEVFPLERSPTFIPVDTEAVEAVDRFRQWARELKQKNKDFLGIVSTDGDGDRPLVTDENGEVIRGDNLGILTSLFLKAEHVVTPINTSTALEKAGKYSTSRTKIGSPFVVQGMKEALAQNPAEIVVGFEANGGFMLGSEIPGPENTRLRPLPTRDSVLPILAVITKARQDQKSLAELNASLPPRFTVSNLVRPFAVEQAKQLIAKIRDSESVVAAHFFANIATAALTKVDPTDGYRMVFADESIIHIRPSGNAPELRCYTEAETEMKADALNRRVIGWIREIG